MNNLENRNYERILYDEAGDVAGTVHKDAEGKLIFKDDIRIRRNIKDSLFRLIFGSAEHKDWALSLYNAIKGTNYTDVDDLTFVTLKDTIFLSMKNDSAILIGIHSAAFFEHQSTVCPNMPYRYLLYTARVLRAFEKANNLDIYSSGKIEIPFPEFYTFYNGRDYQDEVVILKLSDLYARHDPDVKLELIVIQFNINPGMNEELKRKCPPLFEYQWIIDRINELGKKRLNVNDVDKVLDAMPDSFVVKKHLLNHAAEVRNMITEYNEEFHLAHERKLWKEVGFEEGLAEGTAKGIAKGLAEGTMKERADIIRKVMNKGLSTDEVCSLLGLSMEQIDECIAFTQSPANEKQV